MMKEREMTKRNLLILQQMEFEAEANLFRSDKSCVEEKYKEFLKTLHKTKTHLYSPIKNNDKENIKNYVPMIPSKNQDTKEKTDSNSILNISDINPKKPPIPNKRVRPRVPEKHIAQVDLPDGQLIHKKIDSKKEEPDYILKFRLRRTWHDHLVIDKYIQTANSYSPFDDNFNKLVNKFKIYDEDVEQKIQKSDDFNSLYETYLKNKYNQIVVSDSEEEVGLHSQERTFASSFKQFLKHKRSHPDLSI